MPSKSGEDYPVLLHAGAIGVEDPHLTRARNIGSNLPSFFSLSYYDNETMFPRVDSERTEGRHDCGIDLPQAVLRREEFPLLYHNESSL